MYLSAKPLTGNMKPALRLRGQKIAVEFELFLQMWRLALKIPREYRRGGSYVCVECERDDIDRRAFLAASVGSVLVTEAVHEQEPTKTQSTLLDDPGIIHQPVTVKSGDVTIRGYSARPKPAGKYPAIILLEGNAGVTAQLRMTAAQVAQAGFFGLAVDWCSREPKPESKEEQATWVSRITSHTYWKLVLSDIGAAVRHLKDEPSADAAKLGMIGFCGGGKLALLYVAGHKDIKAVVAFYAAACYRSHRHKTDPVLELIDIAKEIKVRSATTAADAGNTADAKEFEQFYATRNGY